MYDWEHDLETLAVGQRGRFTRAQVRGFSDSAPAVTQRRIRSRRWRRLTSRVLAFPGVPVDELGDLWTAHLHVGPDSVLSHLSAARIHELPSIPPTPPTLTVPDGSNRRYRSGRLYQRNDLQTLDVVDASGLPVTSVARTLVDLAATFRRIRLEPLVDHVIGERMASIGDLRETVGAVARPGKRGVPAMSAILEDRLPGDAVEASVLERTLTAALRQAGLAAGTAQYEAPGGPGDRSGLVDRAWPHLRWVVEADGRRWHAREAAMAADRARDRAAASVGWQVTRFTHHELTQQIDGAVEDLMRIWRRRHVDLGLVAPPVRS